MPNHKSITPKIIVIIFGLALISFSIFTLTSIQSKPNKPVENGGHLILDINGTKITVEIAKTPAELERGLSGRTSLGEREGMLFYLPERKIATFWMKDMKFPIDIIWIDNNTIAYFVENAAIPIGNGIPTYTPDKPATHVLEVNAGFIAEHNLKIGDELEIPAN